MANNGQQGGAQEESIKTVSVKIAELEEAEFTVLSGTDLRIKLEPIDFSFSF